MGATPLHGLIQLCQKLNYGAKQKEAQSHEDEWVEGRKGTEAERIFVFVTVLSI